MNASIGSTRSRVCPSVHKTDPGAGDNCLHREAPLAASKCRPSMRLVRFPPASAYTHLHPLEGSFFTVDSSQSHRAICEKEEVRTIQSERTDSIFFRVPKQQCVLGMRGTRVTVRHRVRRCTALARAVRRWAALLNVSTTRSCPPRAPLSSPPPRPSRRSTSPS